MSANDSLFHVIIVISRIYRAFLDYSRFNMRTLRWLYLRYRRWCLPNHIADRMG